MTLPELSIRRHVLAYMISAVMVLFGLIGFRDIGVDRFPEIEFPLVSVTTVLPGASPEIVDSSITNIIESSVNSVPGIDFIQSNSAPGVSQVLVTFNLAKDIDVAFNEVQAKVNQVLRELPDDADPPVVAKVEAGASAIMWIALQGIAPCSSSTSTPITPSASASRPLTVSARCRSAAGAPVPFGSRSISTGWRRWA